jgi:hypothetical protein
VGEPDRARIGARCSKHGLRRDATATLSRWAISCRLKFPLKQAIISSGWTHWETLK